MIRFTEPPAGREVTLDVRDVVLAGYTGRDQQAVQSHVRELAAHGVAAPERVPSFYRVTPDRVLATDRIAVLGPHTSGEGEFILFHANGEVYVGVGSDHTDRAVERESVRISKQLCQKVVAPEVWRLADVRDHWDRILLRSFADDAARPYQEGPAAALLDPEEILGRVEARINGGLEGVLVFSGTLPLAGELTYASRFRVELLDPLRGTQLEVAYAVEVHEPLD
jgi:Protein of unknown function (DUF2848)